MGSFTDLEHAKYFAAKRERPKYVLLKPLKKW